MEERIYEEKSHLYSYASFRHVMEALNGREVLYVDRGELQRSVCKINDQSVMIFEKMPGMESRLKITSMNGMEEIEKIVLDEFSKMNIKLSTNSANGTR